MTAVPAGLIVSFTPSTETPWREPADMVRLAGAAQAGGASAVKVDGVAAARAVKRAFPELPLIAVQLDYSRGAEVWITRTQEQAVALRDAGADFVELGFDTAHRRAEGQDPEAFLRELRDFGVVTKANVGTAADARMAVAAGAVAIGSSMMGYPPVPGASLPDLGLVAELVAATDVPVVAERGYSEPEQIAAAFRAGARAVVVGSAIVDPVWLTRRFAALAPPIAS